MAERAHITPEMLRLALSELMLASSVLLRRPKGHQPTPAQVSLLQAIDRARAVMRGPVEGGAMPTNAEDVVRAFVSNGGQFRDLAAAVNRLGLWAARERYELEKETKNDQEKA